ncbi:MAG: hypothetical protein ABIH22_01840 [Candidatus Margulisiibacteriota bacterium]
MPFSNLDLRRVYYYVICTMAFFILMWGAVDLASSSIGIYNLRGARQTISAPAGEMPIAPEKGEQFFDTYYQGKMLQDRFWDSLARIVVSGIIFAYCRFTVNKLEKQV